MPALLAPLVAWLSSALGGLFASASAWVLTAGFTWLITSIVPLAKKLLIGLGVGVVVYQGMEILLDYAYTSVQSQVNGLPSQVLVLFGWLEIDKMISVLFSAYSTKIALTLAAGSTTYTAPTHTPF